MTPLDRRELLIRLRPVFLRRARVEERLERESKMRAPRPVASERQRRTASNTVAIERAHRIHVRELMAR